MALESDLDWGWFEVGDGEGWLYVNDRRYLGNRFEYTRRSEGRKGVAVPQLAQMNVISREWLGVPLKKKIKSL